MDLRPGSIVGDRYRVEEQVGAGGHGAVYRATDTRVGRGVALKVLHPEVLGSGDVAARFEQEALLARDLTHPNTVRLLDFGREADQPYIVYELLQGRSLESTLQHGALDASRVAHITSQILKSLMEAHSHGIVHRDIKPANIFLCEYPGARDFVKVLDFGIAKAKRAPKAITAEGFTVGTPSYMAPEQLRGAPVGPASDLYAVGLLAAEALCGERLVTGTPEAVVTSQLRADAVELPAAVLQSPLGPVIHRATQKASERRFVSAEEMLAQIEGATAERPIVASAHHLPNAPTGELAALPLETHAPALVDKRAVHSRWVVVIAATAVAAVAAVVLVSVLSGGGRAPSADERESRSKRKRRQAEAGVIRGRVFFTGAPPAMDVHKWRRADSECSPGVVHNAFVAGERERGGLPLADVAVFIHEVGGAVPPAKGDVTLNVADCSLSPRIATMQRGQRLVVTNSGTFREVIQVRNGDNGTQLFFAGGLDVGASYDRVIENQNKMLVYLQNRPYGRSFVVLTDHPYSAVTDKTGEFRIQNVSAGTYELRSWHSLYGEKSVDVTLEVGEGATATLTYDGTEPAPPGNSNEREALDTMF